VLIGSRLSVEKGIIAQRLFDRDRSVWSQSQSESFVQLSEARRDLGRFLLFPFLLFAT
jgi:hypothetical protein